MDKCHKICDFLCTSSDAQYEQLKIIYPNKKIFFHSLPTQIGELTKQGNLVCPEITDCNDYILFFGRVDLYKGIEYLCKAFLNSDIAEKTKLVIAGKSVENYNPSSNIFNENIIFINRYIYILEIRTLFENAKCVVYPYISITQSGVVSFPYYFHIPVIASDLDYFKDEIIDGKTGLLFENKNSDDLAKKLTAIFDGSMDIEAMKQAQGEQYEKCYSMDLLGRELEEMYDSLMGEIK